jgi:hypothetical protein
MTLERDGLFAVEIDVEEVERYELVESAPYRFELERREFMRIFALLGGGLAVVASMPQASDAQESGRGAQGRAIPRDVAAWLHIDEKGQITAFTGKTEIGQNIRTSLAQAVADELRVPLGSVTMVMADTDRVPFDGGTFGCFSTVPQLTFKSIAGRWPSPTAESPMAAIAQFPMASSRTVSSSPAPSPQNQAWRRHRNGLCGASPRRRPTDERSSPELIPLRRM